MCLDEVELAGAGPSCDDAQYVGTLTTASICDTRGLGWTGRRPDI